MNAFDTDTIDADGLTFVGLNYDTAGDNLIQEEIEELCCYRHALVVYQVRG